MQQADINRAVARVTNETIATIRRYGFVIEEPPEDAPLSRADSEANHDPSQEGANSDLVLC